MYLVLVLLLSINEICLLQYRINIIELAVEENGNFDMFIF